VPSADKDGIMEKKDIISKIRKKKAIISDMDGVIYHGNKLLPGVPEFPYKPHYILNGVNEIVS